MPLPNRNDVRSATFLLCLISIGLVGCTTLAPAPKVAVDAHSELAGHVQFLTQPKLKGRSTRTTGAKLARRYIEDQFQASGLLPWGSEKNYELSYGLGKNVIGILPGSDPALADEFVLLSAHYDHLGKDKKGRICPGAADNASGVAALLHAARQLGLSQARPKRTIVFAAFDGEEQMLLGSFAFACREDVERAKLVGIINVDMLGRDFLDTVTNTVFVAGTERFPELRTQVLDFGTEAGMRILPLGSDLIGPRSDHVVFESREVPCLFFSCGTFPDYHKPTDTAEKLNYANLERSAGVILRSLRVLADGASLPPAQNVGVDRAELESVRTVVAELSLSPEKAGIKPGDISKLQNLQTNIEHLLVGNNYTRDTREQLIIEASRSLLPYLLPFGDGESQADEGWQSFLPYLEHIYLNYHRELIAGQKQLIAKLVKNRPTLLSGLPPFKYEVYDIREGDVSILPSGPDTFSLHALANKLVLETRTRRLIWPFKGFGFTFSATFEPFDCEGTPEQLTDFCLLRLRREATNELHVRNIGRVLRTVPGANAAGDYADWLKARMRETGHAQEADWLLSCLTSGKREVAREAIAVAHESKDPRLWTAAREILLDHNARGDLRSDAMYLLVKRPNRSVLLTLAEVLDDSTVIFEREFFPQFREDYPLANSMSFRTVRPIMEKIATGPFKTIGQTALEHLKKLTKKDFGNDSQKWKAYASKSS